MADITVTLMVDTANITTTTVADNCTLFDTNGDASGSTSFTIDTTTSKSIRFLIAAKNGSTCLSLTGITAKTGQTDLFATNEAPSSSNNWVGTTIASETQDQTEKFNITFNIGGTEYTLDPKLVIKQGGQS